MKRDLELVRELLIKIEQNESGKPIQLTAEDGASYTHEKVQYQLKLMWQAGLIDAKDISSFDGPDILILGMTWQGHDFLDVARDNNIWEAASDSAEQKGTELRSLPFEIAKELLIETAKKFIFGS
jgi:hypothetical protein